MRNPLENRPSSDTELLAEKSSHQPVFLGTMVRGNGGKAPDRLSRLLHQGFECYQLHWWVGKGKENLKDTASRVSDLLSEVSADRKKGPFISGLAAFGNPLRTDEEGEESRKTIRSLIQKASFFDCSIIGLFTGRIPGTPWEESLKSFGSIFGDFCREAADHGVKLAMENCSMGGDESTGDWNLAFGPDEWNRLFEILPESASEVLGLEWEPAHQILQGKKPLPQLVDWKDRIFHLHGKDAAPGAGGRFDQTLPGNGITDWNQVFRILEKIGFQGSIDIEGYHDSEWNGEREIPGQVRSLNYLKACREDTLSGPHWAEDKTRKKGAHK